ncbi:hypothetical protein JQ557_14660 [Bradyrhizobium sp. U87765 SZCCT0131]|uniref:hypothetical protein n=1 Tax=unclassified Bradyrhizobium TaxID=2631580 RepID=UPI001BAE36CB|nr:MULTISPECIES: hypothetical protein [unclassified Bradyrhizobium]MBR1219242.1 hypothetical protein [Bradyrhizobium sp. U87765 SZCCT0131]MBR1261893.1 hypothetical protein [Bradyrhizobium sp. U87765 SZCCT0134]MBR1306254.1 hypothetical protein [Bradyrhizobium sp. U87765 SZCCT0110]MBR1317675.1 hypothetical protein [Bradyrhizobium sp. U87765 SZCCT0109]MBR1351377.1 hypothetical protein [Bradyrhizobium sp. U87765 SZCCT0048]
MAATDIVTTLKARVSDWLLQRRQLRELAECEADPADFARMAHEFSMTPDALDALVRQGPHSADELPHMLDAVGVNANEVRREHTALLSDMERVCAFCQEKRRCRQDIAAGAVAEHYRDYCGNAATIGELKAANEG